MIEIQNINTNDSNDIFNLLSKEKKQPFHIYFSKETVLFSSSNDDIADDYARLAYVGHKLNQVSDNLYYEHVQPHEYESILFKVETTNLKSLSEILLELSYLFNNDTDDDEEMFALDNVYQYIDDVEQGKITPVCTEFYEDYREYIGEIK